MSQQHDPPSSTLSTLQLSDPQGNGTARARAAAGAGVGAAPSSSSPSSLSAAQHLETGADTIPERHATILYATETGTSLSLSETLYAQLQRKRFDSLTLCSLDDYDPLSLAGESLVVFVVSVTGQGEFPTAARSFWRFLLRSDLAHDALDHLSFAAFGCGDSSYPRFNWPVRMLRRRLAALGADELVEHGEGDEQHYLGMEGTFLPWLETLWSKLDEVLPLPPGVKEVPEDELLPPRIGIRFLEDSTTAVTTDGPNGAAPTRASSADEGSSPPQPLPPPPPGMTWARLTRNERMTDPSHFQDVRLLTFTSASPSTPLEYEAGDVLHLLPSNPADDVARLLTRLGWSDVADTPLELVASNPSQSLPASLHSLGGSTATTLRALLTHHLDPFSVPRRSFFDFIRRFSPPGGLEREKLDEFVSPGEGADEMYEYAQRVRRTMAEVLYEFKSVEVEPRWVMELFPLMRQRAFSIASSPQTTPGEVTLAVALVSYKTRLHDMRWGVCSRYLSTLATPTTLPVRISRGTFRLPPSLDAPLLLIGPGTGVAPLRSLLHSRIHQAYLAAAQGGGADVHDGQASRAKPAGECLLVTGCRFRKKDWLFGDEWQSLDAISSLSSPGANGQGSAMARSSSTSPPPSLTERLSHARLALSVEVAASRDQEDKVYVQHMVARHSARIWDMVARRGGYVYISGSSGKMPEQVRDAFEGVCREHGGMDDDQARRFVDALEMRGRWQEECWS
ncbi:uncharacterized protein PFL1_05373 [Pseudozyma flocculosa PF-1]|uniref:NADPH-dependent diflavin oxidoreductase 1 n=2 Tax=Pseudozyma flocculosa TaxID=84751 RepID=A0A5C3FA68_9BASI|nr:uncharacterized protein PFL1_05373 [Pseudozyma flocculosa PF-1]EPQ27089.1 hypothetical protein PFL1_05373 [Pseudozyma flocculosa PF-1]SPO41343.1 related to NADPH-dependent FMN and FAD containing oxidoreductase (NR1) [Pseudozyma flocculosa]